MKQLTLIIVCGLLAAAFALAQESPDPPVTQSVPDVAADAAGTETAADDAEELDDADLDEQTYEEDDDDFVPTEEIPADEPIPFPTNI